MFCTNCGALLDKEAKFCPSCGMQVVADFAARAAANPAKPASSPDASNDLTQSLPHDESKQILENNHEAFATQEVVDVQDDSGLFVDTTSLDETFLMEDNAPTEYIPVAANAPVSPVVVRQAAAPRRDRNTIIAAVAIAVIVLATCAMLAIIFWPSEKPNEVAVQPPVEKPGPAAPKTDAKGAKTEMPEIKPDTSKDEPAVPALDYYKKLSEIYISIGGYDDAVRLCSSDFNENYLKPDMNKRNELANSAATIEADLLQLKNDIAALAVPRDSPYSDDFKNMTTLAEDLYQRIHVINRAWSKANSYGVNSKDHDDEIKEVLKSVYDSNNKNKYFEEFNALYPKAQPTKK
ncbi:zinc ribbon domain-containing protein [uncultured Olegusella sp.]|uniref:zinc ribbon domain-containing protein n=1 Tax=uncultured Olegusella sp. TaxID=1979846 RepID=UPI0026155308|nr:zinc ribbon domain-containing protein [uncultured Olegusella sp.]